MSSSMLANLAKQAATASSRRSGSVAPSTAAASALKYLPLVLSGTALGLQLVYLVPGALKSQENAAELRLLREELAATRALLLQQQQHRHGDAAGASSGGWAASTVHHS